MFGFNGFVVETILIWSLISLVLVESGRQARDVHHMIILKDDARPLKSYRHKHRVHNRGRSKRKPPRKHASYSEESFEDDSYESYEEFRPHKPKSGSHEHDHSHKHHHKSHRNNNKEQHHKHSTKHNRLSPEPRPFPNGNKWVSTASQELFGNPYRHTVHFHHQMPMEITTAQPIMFPNEFVHYGNPDAFNHMNALSQSPLSSGDYKPFDYSILEQQNVISNGYPTREAGDSGGRVKPTDAGTTFAIVSNNSAEKNVGGVQKVKNEVISINSNPSGKDNRAKGRNRFRINIKGQQ